MKKIILIVLIFFNFNASSQTYDGIELGKSLIYTQKIIYNKGYKFEYSLDSNITCYSKYVNNKKIDLIIVFTPKSKLVWKIVVAIDYINNWKQLKETYVKYTTALSSVYGNNIENEVVFKFPYQEGDGNELEALYLEKAYIYTIYKDENDNLIMLEVNPLEKNYSRIILHFENNITSEINKKEI